MAAVRKEEAKLEKSISKLSGKAKKKAQWKLYNMRYRAKKKSWKKAKARAKKSTTSDPLQGILPGFAEMLSPKVEELARSMVFEALQKSIDSEVAKIKSRSIKAV